MKDNNGFSLIELLAVIALIALLSLVIVPSVINVVNKNKPKLSSTTQKLIFEAAEMYLDANQTDYIKAEDAVYCPTVEDLIEHGFLEEKMINLESGEEYDKTLIVKSSYNGYKYHFEIVKSKDECTVHSPDVEDVYIIIDNLSFSRNGIKKTKVFSSVETLINVPIVTNDIDDNTQLELKIRKGKNYISGFQITGGKVISDFTLFYVIVPRSASVGEYIIEVTGDKAAKSTKNFKIYRNPIILFMGD